MSSEGEGTRGGHVIGHTSSGKAIYASKGENGELNPRHHKDWTEHDHREAAEKHFEESRRLEEEARKQPEGKRLPLYERASNHHNSARNHEHEADKQIVGKTSGGHAVHQPEHAKTLHQVHYDMMSAKDHQEAETLYHKRADELDRERLAVKGSSEKARQKRISLSAEALAHREQALTHSTYRHQKESLQKGGVQVLRNDQLNVVTRDVRPAQLGAVQRLVAQSDLERARQELRLGREARGVYGGFATFKR